MATFSFLVIVSIVTINCFTVISVSSSQLNYFLYLHNHNAENRDVHLLPLPSDGNVSTLKQWKVDANIKIIIHGLNSVPRRNALEVLKQHNMLILAREFGKYDPGLNVILVDWTQLASKSIFEYPVAARNTFQAGIEIAQFLYGCQKSNGFQNWKDVHILGHSLGSHVAGVLGYQIQKLNNGSKIGRITGLDPAGPEFTLPHGLWPHDMTRVLDFTDAHFVDIIHTNMGPAKLKSKALIKGLVGSDLQAGHADFYPNGGARQYFQCTYAKDQSDLCSHQMSVLYYALSLREPAGLMACPCSSYAKFVFGLCNCYNSGGGQALGELTSTTASGKYFLIISKKISAEYFAN